MISPGQNNDFEIEHVGIFVAYLDFYKSTGSANPNFCPTEEGW